MTARSGFTSLFTVGLKFPVTIQTGPVPVVIGVVGVTKVPSPLPRKSESVLSLLLATMMSSMLLLRTLAVVTKTGTVPVVSVVVGRFADIKPATPFALPARLGEN